MAIIVEDGTVIANANSYVSVAFIDTFCANLGLSSWEAADDDDKDTALLRAMAYIEGMSFKGYKTEDDQTLKWPREAATDEDGYAIDTDAIPTCLKNASARAAYEELASPGILQGNLTRDDFTTSERVDVISITYEQGKNEIVFRAIDTYLSGIVVDFTSLVRV